MMARDQDLSSRKKRPSAETLFAAALAAGNLVAALEHCRQLPIAKHQRREAFKTLAKTARAKGDAVLAMRMLEGALELDGGDVEALLLKGNLEFEGKRTDEALVSFLRAQELAPDDAAISGDLGTVYCACHRYEEAERHLRAALSGLPHVTAYHNSLGSTLKFLGRPREALAEFEAAVRLSPDFAPAYWNMAIAHLLLGEFEAGWRYFDWRWKVPNFPSPVRTFEQPEWKGEPIAGKRLLIHHEQGLGDTIQFLRYGAMVKRLGATVIVECQPQLSGLLRSVHWIDTLVVAGQPLPPFDTYSAVMALPRLFGTTEANIPADVPYLFPAAGRMIHWRKRLKDGAGLKVGLVWAGNPRHDHDRRRSFSLEQLAPLFEVPGTTFYSLQMGEPRKDIGPWPLVDLGGGIEGFDDTAAIVSELDLLITCDTSIAHLAGAIARPVWVFIPNVPDWRWLLEREDSPWYPTLRLFRQRDSEDGWEPVVARIKAALEREAASFRGETLPLPDRVVERQCRAGRMFFRLEDGDAGRSLYTYGEHAELAGAALARLLRPGDEVLEIGAGVGALSLPIARLIGAGGRLVALEGRADAFRLLCANLTVNGHHQVVARHGEPASHFDGSGDAPQVDVDSLIGEKLRLMICPADDEDRLAACAGVVEGSRPLIFLSGMAKPQSAAVISLLEEWGYDMWWHVRPLFNPDNFARCRQDIFGGRNSVNLLCAPGEMTLTVVGARKVEGPHDWWDQAAGS